MDERIKEIKTIFEYKVDKKLKKSLEDELNSLNLEKIFAEKNK